MTWRTDMQRSAHVVRDVDAAGTGGWNVSLDDGASIFVQCDTCPFPPRIGEAVLLFGRGFGYPVRGIVIGGRVYRYETAEEFDVRRSREEAERKHARAADYEAKRADYDARAFALPDLLRQRLDGFRRRGGDEVAARVRTV